MTEETVVKAYSQKVAPEQYLHHTNPVEETAINSAIRSGRIQVMEALLGYEPSNLVSESDEN